MLTRTVRRFLQKPRIARLATIGADGYPHIVTIYFMLDGDDIILGSDRDERKVRNALANPKGAVIIGGDPATDEAGYMFQGDLSIEEDAGHAVMRKAGHDLAVYDVVDAPVRELEKVGAKVAHSSKEVAEKSDLIITMLPDSPDVETAALGPSGIFEGIRQGSTYIDMSTISPVTSKKLAEVAKTKGVRSLDAPVSGGEKGATEATLTIMVGGAKEVFDDCLPIFQVLGKNIVYCGGVGAGQVVKACNQILVAGVLEAASEALVLGTKAGVDPEIVLKVIAGGYAMRVLDVRGPLILKGDFKPGFKTKLHYKDLGIALAAGSEYGVPLPVTSLIHEIMGAMKVWGRGEYDHSGIITVLQELAKAETK